LLEGDGYSLGTRLVAEEDRLGVAGTEEFEDPAEPLADGRGVDDPDSVAVRARGSSSAEHAKASGNEASQLSTRLTNCAGRS
jgi:hypothetical protein